MKTVETLLNFLIENKEYIYFFGGIAIVILLIPTSEVREDFEGAQSISDLPNISQALNYRELKLKQMTANEQFVEISKSGCITPQTLIEMKQLPETNQALKMLDLKMSQQNQGQQYATLKQYFGGNK